MNGLVVDAEGGQALMIKILWLDFKLTILVKKFGKLVTQNRDRYSISAAFNINIHSYVLPAVSTGYNTSPYEAKIVGCACRKQADNRFTLMWTPMTVPGPGQPINPTHKRVNLQ